MSTEEWLAWQAWDAMISPIGAERSDRQTALLATILANVNRDPKREPFTLDDFDLYRIPPPMTREQEEAQFVLAFETAGYLKRAS